MLGSITQEQRAAARVAGFMYLFLGALAAFAEFYVRSGILVHGDVAQTAHNIVASERLFRIGIATDLIGGACNAILAVAFYTMLKQVSASLALLAAFWRLGEAVILGHMTLNGMTALNILSPSALPGGFSPGQLQALANLYVGTEGDEFSIGLVYYSLGSTLFCYLLLKSRYVPSILAWWGLASSFVALISTLAIIVFPSADGIAPGCYVPVGLFEMVTGFWLLLAGIRISRFAPASSAPQ
jgi:Domain of unknown function (DUF4386)